MTGSLLLEEEDFFILEDDNTLLLDFEPEPPPPPGCNIGLLKADDTGLIDWNSLDDHILICFSPTRVIGVSISLRWWREGVSLPSGIGPVPDATGP